MNSVLIGRCEFCGVWGAADETGAHIQCGQRDWAFPLITVKNGTPHAIHVEPWGVTIPASGIVARRSEISNPAKEVAGIGCVTKTLGANEGLPDAEPGVIWLVSAITREGSPERTDLFSPDEVTRDEQGRVTGWVSFTQNPPPSPAWEVPTYPKERGDSHENKDKEQIFR